MESLKSEKIKEEKREDEPLDIRIANGNAKLTFVAGSGAREGQASETLGNHFLHSNLIES